MYSCIQESLGGLSKCLPTRLLITTEKKPGYWHQFLLTHTNTHIHTFALVNTQIICFAALFCKRMTAGRSPPISALVQLTQWESTLKMGTKSICGKNSRLICANTDTVTIFLFCHVFFCEYAVLRVTETMNSWRISLLRSHFLLNLSIVSLFQTSGVCPCWSLERMQV